MLKQKDDLFVIDFDALRGVRWQISSTGYRVPPGVFEVEITWENGFSSNLVSLDSDVYSWAEELMDGDENTWYSDELPDIVVSQDWYQGDDES